MILFFCKLLNLHKKSIRWNLQSLNQCMIAKTFREILCLLICFFFAFLFLFLFLFWSFFFRRFFDFLIFVDIFTEFFKIYSFNIWIINIIAKIEEIWNIRETRCFLSFCLWLVVFSTVFLFSHFVDIFLESSAINTHNSKFLDIVRRDEISVKRRKASSFLLLLRQIVTKSRLFDRERLDVKRLLYIAINFVLSILQILIYLT